MLVLSNVRVMGTVRRVQIPVESYSMVMEVPVLDVCVVTLLGALLRSLRVVTFLISSIPDVKFRWVLKLCRLLR